MREFEKSNKLEGVSYDVRGPVLEEAERMQEEGISILKLNTGNPAPFGFEAPNEVIRDLIMNAQDSEGYSDSKGIFSARKAIEQYCQIKKFPNVTIKTEKEADSDPYYRVTVSDKPTEPLVTVKTYVCAVSPEGGGA